LNKQSGLYLPKPINEFIAKFELGISGKDNEANQKANRMNTYWKSSFENGEKLNNAWRKLEKYAISDDKLASLFFYFQIHYLNNRTNCYIMKGTKTHPKKSKI